MEILIKKNGTKSFREKIYVNGKPITQTFARKTDADSWKRRLISDRDRGIALGISPRREISFEDFRLLWNERKAGSLSVTTRVRYLGLQRLYLSPNLNAKMLRGIDKETVEDLVVQLRKSEIPLQTIDQVVRVLKTMLFDAIEWDYLKTNPASHFAKLAKKSRREEYWDEAQAQKFLDFCKGNPLFHVYLIAIRLGLRRGELAGLKWSAVNLSTNNISICRVRDRYGERETTKTGEKREIFMNSEIRRIFSDLNRSKNSEYVFSRPDGRPIDIQHVYRAFNRAQKEAKVERTIHFHDLRHTFASIFLMRGGNLNALAKIMGHSKVSMTERYGHITPNHVAEELEKMRFGDRPLVLAQI